MSSWRLFALVLGAVLILLATASLAGLSYAAAAGAPRFVQTQPTNPPPQMSIADETCLACHSQPGLTMTLENGELWGLYIPPELHAGSIHGQKGYACVQCHTNVGDYPHPPFNAEDERDASLQLYPACQRCHASYYELTQDSVHTLALQSGNRNAAICTDCHTAHAVRPLTNSQSGELLPETRQWIPQTCAKCHYAIYQKYSNSVHGAALLAEGNSDVPTCIDCHGVHDIHDPTTASFRLRSPEICANCHTNPEIMDKYGISTQVLDTYVADFHGTTVTLFEKQHPDQETNKPVCYDCHGIHDIKSTDDPQKGLQVRENLLARCQACHPDANQNFPTAWLSHYIPSPDRHPLVFTVDTFYKFFIPGLLGGMAILVALDAGAILRKRLRRVRSEHSAVVQPPAETIPAGVSLDQSAQSPDQLSEVESQVNQPAGESLVKAGEYQPPDPGSLHENPSFADSEQSSPELAGTDESSAEDHPARNEGNDQEKTDG